MKPVLAELITIGDEIMIGQITDTNTQWLSEQLNLNGIKVIRKSSVGDEQEQIIQILAESESRADIIIITGGLGPTKDDITKHSMAIFFESEFYLNQEVLKMVSDFFVQRGKEISEVNKLQAWLPVACSPIMNYHGTAPGMWFEKNGKVFISMPGVPFEMKEMTKSSVIPQLQRFFNTPRIYHRTVLTAGIGESVLAELIAEWEDGLPKYLKLAYLPSYGSVRLRLSGFSLNSEDIAAVVDNKMEEILPLIDKYLVSAEGDSLEITIGKLLIKRNLTIATAESCTGGNIAATIVGVPGSSAYFKGGLVAYQNDIKIKELGVKTETIIQYGAVSEQCVQEMALGIVNKLGTSIGIAVSGIAGPTGGTVDKPVGTTWIAISNGDKTISKLLKLGSLRETNIKYTTQLALNAARIFILENY